MNKTATITAIAGHKDFTFTGTITGQVQALLDDVLRVRTPDRRACRASCVLPSRVHIRTGHARHVPMSADRLRMMGSRYRRTRARMENERQELHDEIRASAGTMSEAEIARVTGVQRETVRKALGK